jgi:hypothetical protein
MSWFSGLKNPFASKSPSELQQEKETELANLSKSYDEKIEAAKAKETAAAPAAVGTTTAVGRGRKTKRAKKTKSKRSRSGRKSSRL